MISEGLCSKHNRPLSHSKKCLASGKTRLVRTPNNFESNLKEDSIKDGEIDNSKSIEIRKTRSLVKKNAKSSDGDVEDDKSSSNKRTLRKRNSPSKRTVEYDESSSSNSSSEENQSKKGKKSDSKILRKSVSKSSEENCVEAQLNDEKKSKAIENKELEIISINESEEDKSKNNKPSKTRSSSKIISESSEDDDDIISSPKSRKMLKKRNSSRKKTIESNKSTSNENEEKLSEKILSHPNSVLAEDSLLEEPLENKKTEETSIENQSLEKNSKKGSRESLEMECNNDEKEFERKEYKELEKLKKDCLNQKNEIILLNCKVSSLSQSLLELKDRESQRAKRENELKLRIKAHRESDCNQRVVDIENIFLNE